MSYGPAQVFTVSMASGASTTSNLALGKSFSKIYVEIGTMSTNVFVDVYASTDGTVYKQVFERVNTAPVQYQTMFISTQPIGTGVVAIDACYPYLQFRGTGVVSGGCTIKVIGVD